MIKLIFKKIFRGVENSLRGAGNIYKRNHSGASLKPKWVVYMTTDECNSRCKHCSIWKTTGCGNILKPSELENALKDPLFSEVEYVLCTGGEATLRQDIVEVFESIHRALPKARLQLSTNALLPERALNVVKSMMEKRVGIDVGVSLDGIGEKHDEIRGVPGNFEKVDFLMKELVKIRDENGCLLGLATSMVISDLTIDSVDEVRDYSNDLGVDLIEAWYNETDFYSNVGEKVPTTKLREIIESQKPSLVKEKWLKGLDGKPINHFCFALHTFCVIQADGGIVPCLNLWGDVAGNVRDNAPSEIWKSEQAERVRTTVRDCKGCLNEWCNNWSYMSSYLPTLLFRFKHPKILVKDLLD